MKKLALHWQILIALALGIIAGNLTPPSLTLYGFSFYNFYEFISTLFLNSLKMVVVPLIVSSIMTGIGRMEDQGSIGRLGTRAFIYYISTSFIAVMIGLIVINILSPGIVDGKPAQSLLGLNTISPAHLHHIKDGSNQSITNVFLLMFPPNIIKAAQDGQLLGLIIFSMLFGYFSRFLADPLRKTMIDFWEGTFQILMSITDFIIKFAPIGVFAFIAKVASTTGMEAIRPLASFFFSVLLGLGIHMFVVLPLILRFVGKISSPWRMFQAMSPALLTAFSTSSSSASLPVTLECVEHNAGVSNRITSFVLPLGATVNMDGTALYECAVAMFVAQVYGVELGMGAQFLVVFTALLTSMGMAGIPSASLVAIVMILSNIGLPLEAIGIVLAVDRILDMCRTSVNVFSDACGAVVVGSLEGEKGILQNKSLSHL